MTTLNGALPETVRAYNQIDTFGRSKGITVALADFGGVRTLSDTTKILGYRQQDYVAALNAGQIRPDTTLQAFRPISPFGHSYHNYGAAFDLKIVSRPSNMTTDQALRTLAAYAPSIGLRWGGTFPNPDTPHFELAISLSDAQRRYAAFAQSGGASSTLSDLASNFDLGSFLPGLTPSTDDVADALDVPLTDYAGDDSGELAFVDGGGDMSGGSSLTLLALGAVVASVMFWAIRRKFT